MVNPGVVLDRSEAEGEPQVTVVIPRFDSIDPEYVSLYITNFGEHTPSYIYRLFSEYYSKEEYGGIF